MLLIRSAPPIRTTSVLVAVFTLHHEQKTCAPEADQLAECATAQVDPIRTNTDRRHTAGERWLQIMSPAISTVKPYPSDSLALPLINRTLVKNAH